MLKTGHTGKNGSSNIPSIVIATVLKSVDVWSKDLLMDIHMCVCVSSNKWATSIKKLNCYITKCISYFFTHFMVTHLIKDIVHN